MRLVSVDPGVTGALAFFDAGHVEDIKDMPTYDGEVSGLQVGDWITEWNPHFVVIEQQQPMPKNGSVACFKTGLNYGIVVGTAEALRHPIVKMRPPEWKKLNGLTGKDKESSRGLAMQLWPSQAENLQRVKDHNRAEAMLIGRAYIIKHVMEQNK